MSEAKQRCQLDGCSRAASTRCFCCNKNVCTRHFTEHIEAVKAQIDPLANEINTMVEKIQGLTIQQITEASFAELQQWRTDMHQLIDDIFLAKTKEAEDLIETNKNKFDEHKRQQSATIIKIQDDVRQLVEDGDATFEQIQLLKNQLASVEKNLISFQQDFLSVSARIFAQGLVTVSSNVTKPLFFQSSTSNQPPPQNPQYNVPNSSTQQSTGYSFGDVQNKPLTFSFSDVPIKPPTPQPSTSSFGSAQNNASTQKPTPFSFPGFTNKPPTTASGIFGSTPLNSPFGSSAPSQPASVGSSNNPPLFGSTVFPQFINKGKK